jgi:PAS domain S-box-containing protein
MSSSADGFAGDARFRLMFERSSDAVLLLDTSTNRFVEYNKAALDMMRCSREELSELHPAELSPPAQPDGRLSFEKANAMIASAIAKGSHRFEWIHRSPHRGDFPVEVLLTPIQEGQAPVLLVVWRDVTERKLAEEALRQAQRLESLGVLAGGLAHDFNNLLTVIAGNLALVGARLDRGHEAAPHLAQIEAAVFRAAELTRQMLAYAGKGAFLIAPVDLSRTVREIAELLRVSIPGRVEIASELAAVPAVNADRAQLQQVVMNLVTNAGEAIGDADGRITLRTSVEVLDEPFLASELQGQELAPGRYVRLEVADTGHGMTPEVLAHIFDPFFSTKRPGRGLGLSALVGIVRAHRGGLRVRSAPGAGTTFQVYFPATETAASSAEPAAPLGRTRGTVLLVDDDRPVRRAGRIQLEYLGLTVLEAADGEEAVGVFRAERARIDFVLMDLTMPRMGGYEAFGEMRRIDPGVRVVLCSGWAESDLDARFRDAPPTFFLPKPYRDADLRRMLDALGIAPDALAERR